MEYSQAAELPVVIDLGTEKVTFPLLEIGDYDAWCAEINAQRKRDSKKLIPNSATDLDKFRMARMSEFEEIPLDVISSLVYTPKGASRILNMSLTKAGMDEAARQAVVRKIAPRYVVSIAVDVSGLFEKRIPPVDEKPLPNDQKDQPQNDPAATGS